MSVKARPSSSLFTLAAIVTAIAALSVAREILLPIALAALVSFLLVPLAKRLERWGLPRVPAVLAVVSVAFVALGLLGWIVGSQLVDLSARLPTYRENIIAKVRAVTHGSETLRGVARTIEDVQEELASEDDAGDERPKKADEPTVAPAERGGDEQPSEIAAFERLRAWLENEGAESKSGSEQAVAVKVVSLPPSPFDQVRGWLGPLVAPLTTAGMVVVLVLFMLLQREDQRNRVIRLFGASNIHATTEALTDIVDRVSRYLRMQFLINAGYGICVGAGLALIGVPNAVMWGVLSFSLRFLPYIGPWISAVMPVAVSLAISKGWTQPILVVSWFVILELIVNNVAEPLLYGSSVGISGMGVILAAIFWTWLWGAIGLVLAMPLTVCLVVMARYVPGLRFITVLLGDQPTLTLAERVYQRALALDDDEVRKLATSFLEEGSRVDLYDAVFIPALHLAERDRRAGDLSDEQADSVQEVIRDLIAEFEGAEQSQEAAAAADASRTRVFCIPLRDEADKTAAMMLGPLLEAEGLEPMIGSLESLTGERVEAVALHDADMVIVSVLPPLPRRDCRLLCRMLRKRYPTLPIVVGFWGGAVNEEWRQLLAAKGDGEIVTKLADAVERARAVASRVPSSEKLSIPAEPVPPELVAHATHKPA